MFKAFILLFLGTQRGFYAFTLQTIVILNLEKYVISFIRFQTTCNNTVWSDIVY